MTRRTAQPATCFTCQARERTEWCALERADLELLDRSKTTNDYRPGQVIYYEGNACLGIHCIESGTVVLRRAGPGGNAVVVGLAGTGQTLGYLAYFGGRGYTHTAAAQTTCRVCFVDRAALRALLSGNPSLGLAFLRRMSVDLEQAEQERVRALSLPLRARAAHLLLVLKDRSSTIDEDGRLTIELPLSRRDLAAMLGARPETLSRLIRDFETDGVARFGARDVVVGDLDRLLDEVELAVGVV